MMVNQNQCLDLVLRCIENNREAGEYNNNVNCEPNKVHIDTETAKLISGFSLKTISLIVIVFDYFLANFFFVDNNEIIYTVH